VWASDIHSNINVQMNYWPVESANLSECHMPLLNYLRNEALRPGGAWQRNAADLGADEGWVVNTAGNIFGGSSAYKAGKYSVAGAWLCDHLWQHYVYTLDRAFLREDAWPLMQSAARFWLKRLVSGPTTALLNVQTSIRRSRDTFKMPRPILSKSSPCFSATLSRRLTPSD
ncbi:MAG: hypothetical protein K2M09_00670, partial [Muribaculaceae bacterium]|nr:hypothetical protein [Muribaculaceae bacterium]